MNCMKLGACMAAFSLAAASIAQARPVSSACASAAEISAIQVAAVQQELTDAALACGPKEVALFNRFQTVFNKELRRSDATMLRRELLIGYGVAGFLTVLVPMEWWNTLFMPGHGIWTTLENVLIGPFIAVISCG